MANQAWENVKETLKKPATPEAMREASQAFKRWQQEKRAQGKGSRPQLVSLGYKKAYPSAIPLDQIPKELETNPELFNLMKRIVTKEGKI